MRLDAALRVLALWIACFQPADGGKLMDLRKLGHHSRVLVMKFKADSFVNASTAYAELGSLRVVSAAGDCVSCAALCSSPDEPENEVYGVQKVCEGQGWSWKVSSGEYDVMMEVPMSKLQGRADFGVTITSAVQAAGVNSPMHEGRQVTNWLLTTVMGTRELSSGRWLRSAWSKVAVSLNGDFRYAVTGQQGLVVTKDVAVTEELFAEHCLRPANLNNYLVSEHSLTRGKLQVTASCKAAFKGKAVVRECEDDLMPYKLTGCAKEFCRPASAEGYELTETSLARGAFEVQAKCAEGYSGQPRVAVCAADEEPYELGGCEATTSSTSTTTTTFTETTTTTTTSTMTSTTSTSTSTSTSTVTSTTTATTTTTSTVVRCAEVADKAYVVTVASLEARSFDVAASCAAGYEGEPVIKACTAPAQPFSLTGCERVVCRTPADTTGYALHEASVNGPDFKVTATCAASFHGTPQVEVCGGQGEEYKISGCSPDECASPEDSSGFLVTETELRVNGFKVVAACADGYMGVAKVKVCGADQEAYSLEGCVETTSSTSTSTTTTTTATSTTTTTSTETSTSTTTVTSTSTSSTTATSTSTTTATTTSTETSTSTMTSTTTETSTTTSTSTVTSTSTETSTTTTETSTSTSTSTTETSTSTVTTVTSTTTSTSTATSTTTTTSTETTTSTSTSTTSTSTSTSTTTTSTSTSTTTTSTSTSTTTSTSTSMETTTTTTSTATSTTTTSTSTETSTTTTSTSTVTSTTTTSTSTVTSSTTTSTVTSTTTTATSTTTTSTSTSTTRTSTSTTTTTTKAVCLAPDDTRGYEVIESSVFLNGFAVTARCATGFEGRPKATKCRRNGERYSLSGCKPVEFCIAPALVQGFLVTEVQLSRSAFQVQVACAEGYVSYSAPRAVVCKGDSMPYSLEGCDEVRHCLAPADATGYLVTETQLLQHDFDVTATCAPGYVGKAVVTPCSKDVRPYSLHGCNKR